jgi:hypothetical protein
LAGWFVLATLSSSDHSRSHLNPTKTGQIAQPVGSSLPPTGYPPPRSKKKGSRLAASVLHHHNDKSPLKSAATATIKRSSAMGLPYRSRESRFSARHFIASHPKYPS